MTALDLASMPFARAGGGARVRWRLDPRTKMALVVAASTAVMAPGGSVFVPAAIALGVLLACLERAWLRALAVPLLAGALGFLAYVLVALVPHPALSVVSVAAAYTLRFVAIGSVAAHLLATTGASELTAAMRAMRVPRAITVSTAVMLRFLPLIATEARAVFDAMRLRGIGGWRGFVCHPALAAERLTVPLIASSLRVGEDLSAAALLRGLGTKGRPSVMTPPRFSAVDAVAVAVAAALTALALTASALLTGSAR